MPKQHGVHGGVLIVALVLHSCRTRPRAWKIDTIICWLWYAVVRVVVILLQHARPSAGEPRRTAAKTVARARSKRHTNPVIYDETVWKYYCLVMTCSRCTYTPRANDLSKDFETSIKTMIPSTSIVRRRSQRRVEKRSMVGGGVLSQTYD